MGRASLLTAPVLEQFLIQARLTKAAVSLRLQGAGSRLLGDLRLKKFRPGSSLQLSGLNARDSVPTEGMPVTLTILLGEEVLTLVRTGEADQVALSTRFLPMPRIEAMYLDEASSGAPSLAETFRHRTGQDPHVFLAASATPGPAPHRRRKP